MARILVVKHLFPYPPSQGTRRVSLALLKDLATEHEVVYLCQLEEPHEATLIPVVERLGVRVVAPLMPNHLSVVHKALYKLQNRTQSLLRGIPEVCFYWSNRALRSNLERLQTEFQPDLTILENWETYRLRRSIRTGIAVLLAHDAAFQLLERAANAAEDHQEKARLTRRLVRRKRLETRAWALFDAILTLTDDDRTTIERELASGPLPGRATPPPVRHLPVPVPEELFTYGRPPTSGKRIGFFGTFRADFNRDALTYLLREIWPEIRRKVPKAELVIAGNGYGGPLKEEARQRGARWLGFVEDLRVFFEAIDLLLIPLRFAAGVRIRILEALAASVPTVATPVSVTGLGIEDAAHFLEATNPEDIAERAEWILAHPAEAADLGKRGRAWCASHHGPDRLRPKRLDVIRDILEHTASVK